MRGGHNRDALARQECVLSTSGAARVPFRRCRIVIIPRCIPVTLFIILVIVMVNIMVVVVNAGTGIQPGHM